jgi:glycosyltransferase involved in cell wall biosynthesis
VSSTAPRVAINGRMFGKPVTGTERFATEIVRELVKRHPERLEIHVPAGTALPEWLRPVKIVRSRMRGPLFDQVAVPLRTIGKTLVNLSGPTSVLKRRQLSVVHDASVLEYPENFALLFRLAYRVMYWAAVHLVEIPVTVSEFSRSEIVKHYGPKAKRFEVVSCGSEHASRIEAVAPPEHLAGPYAVCIGSLTRRKNLGPFLRAADRMGLDVAVIGAAGPSSNFGSVAWDDTAGRRSTIHFLGRLSDAETAWVIDRASALVFPSLYEGFGLPVVEAQRRGCAVIAADTSSLPEVLRDSALYFPPFSPETALAHLTELERAPELRADLVRRGAANSRRYTWSRSAERVAALLGLDAGGRR